MNKKTFWLFPWLSVHCTVTYNVFCVNWQPPPLPIWALVDISVMHASVVTDVFPYHNLPLHAHTPSMQVSLLTLSLTITSPSMSVPRAVDLPVLALAVVALAVGTLHQTSSSASTSSLEKYIINKLDFLNDMAVLVSYPSLQRNITRKVHIQS